MAEVGARAKALAKLQPGAAARCSPTPPPAAAATSMSCSPQRCPGASCATSPGPWRCASRRSTRRRRRLSAVRSALLVPGPNPAAGGCSRCRRRMPGRPPSTRTGRRSGTAYWPSSQPSYRRSREALVTPRLPMLRRNWTLSASRGFPASVAALPWLLNSPRRPYPIDLLLCGHHYRASEIALLAAGATVYGETGAVFAGRGRAPCRDIRPRGPVDRLQAGSPRDNHSSGRLGLRNEALRRDHWPLRRALPRRYAGRRATQSAPGHAPGTGQGWDDVLCVVSPRLVLTRSSP